MGALAHLDISPTLVVIGTVVLATVVANLWFAYDISRSHIAFALACCLAGVGGWLLILTAVNS